MDSHSPTNALSIGCGGSGAMGCGATLAALQNARTHTGLKWPEEINYAHAQRIYKEHERKCNANAHQLPNQPVRLHDAHARMQVAQIGARGTVIVRLHVNTPAQTLE